MAYDLWNKRESPRNWAIGAPPLLTMPPRKLPSFPPARHPTSPTRPSFAALLWLNLVTAGAAYAGFFWLTRNTKRVAENEYLR